MTDEFNVSLETCLEKKIGFEAYFIMWCLYNSKEEDLLKYVEVCKQIPTEEFISLQEKGYLIIVPIYDDKGKLQIHFHSMKLTKSGKDLFEVADFNTLFEEFRTYYPKTGGKDRKLQLDLKRCRALYKKAISNDIDRHKLLCICAKLYYEEKQRTNGQDYLQLMATWLHQENYEGYMDEAIKISNNEYKITTNEGNVDRI